MASGDVIWEAEAGEVADFQKKVFGNGSEWSANLQNYDVAPYLEVQLDGERNAGVYPDLQPGKRYNIKITEV